MNIALILQYNYPGTQWMLTGNEYAGLEWLDETPKPTKAALEKQWPEVQYKDELYKVQLDRKTAYNLESDPIFFKAQRGEATTEEWLAKIAEIQARYPEPQVPIAK